jgi:arabinose-5-phosphate isomerase
MGIGKSGHIAKKISASLSSTGTPSFYVHPTEAGHGDLGMITRRDLVLVLSNSGEQDELNLVLPILRRNATPIACITSNSHSSLAKNSDFILLATANREACPNNLAPTSSTLLQLAIGDALTVACLESRGFTSEDFAHSHPSGSLGRRLVTRISHLMQPGSKFSVVSVDMKLIDVMPLMSASGLGLVAICDTSMKPVGVFTDGDLRRALINDLSVKSTAVAVGMTHQPKLINENELATSALGIMESHKITTLLVVNNDGHLVGAINLNMLLRAKIL